MNTTRSVLAALVLLLLGCAAASAGVIIIDPGNTNPCRGDPSCNTVTASLAAGSHGSISPDFQLVPPGYGVAIKVTPEAGYHVYSVTGDTCSFTYDANADRYISGAIYADCAVTAGFIIYNYTVTASAGPNGSITPPTQVIDHDGAASFTVTPAVGYHVDSVSGDTCTPVHDTGDAWTASNITAWCAVSATFAANTHLLGGSVSGLASGNAVVLQNNGGDDLVVAANSAFQFATAVDYASTYAVSVLTQPSTPAQTCIVANGSGSMADADVSNVQVTCSTDTHTVSANVAGGHGTLTPGSQSVTDGATASFTATANAHYHLASISADTCSISDLGGGQYQSGAITADCSVTASFALDTFTLTYTAGSHGSISGVASQTVDYAASGSPVTAVANAGYHFVDWSDGSTANPRTDSNVQADLTVSASFAIDTFTLTYNASANGSITGASPQSVNYGADGTPVTAVANVGYHFVDWSDGSTANPRTDSNVQADLAVSASFAINTHHVGGSVSGLASGNAVVLQNNGDDDLSVAANGAFQFATTVDVGATYSVTVLTEPSTPAQTCTVSYGSGSMPDSDVTDVQVICVTLTPNLSLSVDDGDEYARYGEVRDYQITLSNSGNGAASDVTVHTTSAASFAGVYDTSGASWVCTGTSGGATCTSSGSGLFSDTATLPPGASVTWVASMPILVNGVTPYANYTVSAAGAATAGDQDTLVIYRDGFELPNDPSSLVPRSFAAAVLHGNAEVIAVVPAAAHDGVTTLRVLSDAADSVGLQHLVSANHSFTRLLARGADGQQRATPWAPVHVGARVVVGSVAAGDGQRSLLLEGASRSLTLSITDTKH